MFSKRVSLQCSIQVVYYDFKKDVSHLVSCTSGWVTQLSYQLSDMVPFCVQYARLPQILW